jgi:hypothetical protein
MSAILGSPAAMQMQPALDLPDDLLDDEPLTEDDAKYEAALELMHNIGGCLDTLRNECEDKRTHTTVDGDWLADEACMSECVAVLLQSAEREHIVSAAYRLRELIELSKDGAEFIADRAKELLDEERKATQRREREAREQAFADDGSYQ